MSDIKYRALDQGLGEAVAARTYLREDEDWGDLAIRVALGNTSLHPSGLDDFLPLQNAIASASFLTSGRHLQHGDINQSSKQMELFSNCATACTSFLEFLLLLSGAGVGRNYSDNVMEIDWRNMPYLYCVLSINHPDYKQYEGVNGSTIKIISREDIDAYPNNPDVYHVIEDSREGWAKALELLEVATYQKRKHDHFVFDFSDIRAYGVPIKGLQGRPASGPLPLIRAFTESSLIKYQEDMPIWKQTMIIDHFMSACVACGGARRSSRIAIKYWKDEDILDFITLKKSNPWLWSSNNSIGVDKEFWQESQMPGTLAYEVFLKSTECIYESGEPGYVNLDKLTSID